MKEFEDLQQIWSQHHGAEVKISHEEVIQKSNDIIKNVRRNHIGTIIIIGLTFIILVGYAIWLNLDHFSMFGLGLLFMISSMFVRVVIEVFSLNRFKKINPIDRLFDYKKKVESFYQQRRSIHFLWTPIIYLVYIIGFSILLPTFKKEFSTGFFIYIICSGYGFLIVFAYFMFKNLRKEMNVLKFLKDVK